MTHRTQHNVSAFAPGFRFVALTGLLCGLGGIVVSACADSDVVTGEVAGTATGTGGRDVTTGVGGKDASASSTSGGGKDPSTTSSSVGAGGMGGAGGAGGAGAVGGGGGQGGAGGICVPTTEACNGLDDDCNGQIDDKDPDGGAACDAQNGVGECAKGTLHCINAALECVAALPVTETCDGLDNNCDGSVDEADPGGGAQCVTQLPGACAIGTLHCQGASGVQCEPNIMPGQQAETCNGLDDDCNGMSDEGDPGGGVSCVAAGFGECKNGTQHCQNGMLKCTPAQAQPEICDGLDNNCDGNTDEGNPGGGVQCMTGLKGLCATGITKCSGQAGVTCEPSVIPGALTESCNGLDDDCDGLTDEDIPQVGQPCTAQGFVGICQFGTYSCPTMAPFQLKCDHPAPGTIPEVCNNKDDDCNGTIDDPALLNNLPCNSGLPGICGPGKTLCSGGAQTCTPNVAPGSQPEICNNLDDNCNGMTDEMNPTPACTSQNPNAQFVQAWSCTMGTCQIAMCQPAHADINVAPGDGCECSTDSWQNTCGVASTLSVSVGGSSNMVGKIETASGSDWVTFNFTSTGTGNAYHPKIQLVDSAGGQYAMDVMVDCNNSAGCSTVGGANNENGINVNIWEQNYNAYNHGDGCCSDNTPRVTSVKVRVYRKNADTPTCASYTVTGSNM